MREIKFRAWLKGHMVYIAPDDDYFIDGDGRLVKIEQFENGCSYQVFEDHECNLMQYTGLKDKNGKDIYEGDVVCYNGGKTESRAKMTVKWLDAGFVLTAYREEWVYNLGECISDTLEIIGNLYENPELSELS